MKQHQGHQIYLLAVRPKARELVLEKMWGSFYVAVLLGVPSKPAQNALPEFETHPLGGRLLAKVFQEEGRILRPSFSQHCMSLAIRLELNGFQLMDIC